MAADSAWEYDRRMPTSAILLAYQERIIALHATASQMRLGQIIALIILIVSIVAIGTLAFLTSTRRAVPLSSAVLPIPVAIYAGKIMGRRNKALLQTLRLQGVYQRGVERLEGRWVGTGTPGDEYATQDDHPYAKDLHVFGEGSLFELLCTCRTDVGRRRLAQYFLTTPTLEEARRRQAAVQELKDNIALRERIQVLGEFSFQESTWNTIAEWLDSPVVKSTKWLRWLALIVSVCLGGSLLAEAAAVVHWSQIAFPAGILLAAGGLLALPYRERVLAAQPALRALSLELGVLREGLGVLETQEFRSPLLKELVEVSVGSAARLKSLERFTKATRERDKEWFYHVSRLLLVGTQLFLRIELWRRLHGPALRRWLGAWGEFEAIMALANYAAEHPQNVFPTFTEQAAATLECEEAGHPLLESDVCVSNDVAWNERTRFYVVSGSNMAGKSTLLRMVGLNVVLAYAGAPVCAAQMKLSRLWICASISIQDSLLNGKSKFMAEVDRLKLALTVDLEQRPVLFLIDEILSGTNSKDRRTATEAILRSLLEQGAIGAISTHDLALTELADLPELAGANVHMGSRADAEPLDFDYVLKPGVTRQSSALAIARLAGVAC